MFSGCMPRREPLTADNFPSGPSAPEFNYGTRGAFDAPHQIDAPSTSVTRDDADGPYDRVCVIVNVRAPAAKIAVKRLRKLHASVEVLVMDSESQEALLRRLQELLVGDADRHPPSGDRTASAVPPPRVRFLAGGGDGTVAAAASLIALACERARLPQTRRAPVAPLPLGTGNELSRISGWGAAYGGGSMANIVRNVAGAYLSKLDMWTATIVPSGRGTRGGGFGVDADKDADADANAETKVRRKFVCFFSVGFDAHISHRFTKRRERDPSSCATVWQNKAWYAYYGAKEFMSGGGHLTGDDGKQIVELYVDDKRVDVPRDLNSVQVFNIHSSADGVDFWGTNRPSVKGELPDSVFVPPCVGDGMLEVVGTRGVSDLVAVRNGFAHSKRLAQGGRVELRLSAPVAAQMDGETWVQSPCVVRIEHAGGIPLCVGPGGTRNLQPGLETTGGGGGCLRL